MFTIEGNTILANRGDVVYFSVTAEDDGDAYLFQVGDLLRMKVFEKKNAENVVMERYFPVTEECESVDIFLAGEDTKFGEVISKQKDYWYEIELNPFTKPQTIVGYHEDGPAVFRLYPKGADLESVDPLPEEIPVVDAELDPTSSRPVQNQAVARRFLQLEAEIKQLRRELEGGA